MFKKITFGFMGLLCLAACSTNPVTGRRQLKVVSEQEMQAQALTQYRQFLSTSKVVSGSGDKDAEMVRRVGQRIANAVTQYYQQQKLSGTLDGYQWEYNLVNNNEANAWCMPGGKIVVYTGLLPFTQNEAALAVVMGHEVSHAIFQHGTERMSQGLLQQGLGTGLQVALANKPAATQAVFNQAYGIASNVGVILPFSRKQEYEADHYGLIWAAMAGYNPKEAIPLWERMEKAAAGQKPPEFLSTHPSEGNRITQLNKYMDEALKYYKPMGSR